jgi:hypothetical protein
MRLLDLVKDPREFGMQWWCHREGAKVNREEGMRLVWWEVVGRGHSLSGCSLDRSVASPNPGFV